ncbi:hypothetical protein [Flavobacterium sp. CAU 1735]|uniref:hypothetical protein n=1 Tax=Flavobacterium sp. CAU 1735 TaxID=3140361 RepID=UPI0032607B8A
MKTKLLTVLLLVPFFCLGQNFKVNYSFDKSIVEGNLAPTLQIQDPLKKDNFKSVFIQMDGNLDGKKTYEIYKGDQKLLVLKNDKNWYELKDGTSPLFDKQFEIRDVKTPKEKLEFTFQYNGSSNENRGATYGNVDVFVKNHIKDKYKQSKFGLVDDKGAIHIFIDQFGNSLQSTLPQGVPYFKYYVHVVYLDSKTNPNYIYSVDQTKGSIDTGIFIENPDAGKFKLQGANVGGETLIWYVNETALQSSNKDNIEFDIYRTQIKEGLRTKIGSFIIKMAPTFHASINVGLYVTQLENPDYTLVDLGNSTSTVKKSLEGGNGVITATATLYTSPIILLESLIEKDQDKKKALYTRASTRCYINDHEWYEKIYPTVGVKLGDKAFENLFAGFSFEVARGATIFFGGNYSKVNYFEGDFDFGTETITPQEFDLRKKEKWDWGFAYGVNLDLRIIGNLFGQ